ncbi:protein FAR1-RELATED SEQUENCE 5-like [Pyrus ussuriensis x Pyrus communis]|uniref:Protein FAR1-RELATED SEQUENCE 5-like n=1 Tax=Pyrus ussuriensis x Pyrus communis TaxID=2448454 RepID=A0A5N5HL10_9ROSA|nr:protein FAR1-RELATED SEQUENCE 5-like [Pyrus ussuriensis x Pyrus communis]
MQGRLGFSVRMHSSKKNKDGEIMRKEFVCNRGNCEIKLGGYVITIFDEGHNHPIAFPRRCHLLKSHRKVTKYCYNIVNKEKMVMFKAWDAQKNRMTNVFWRDGRSRLDYECFGDVLAFGTTYHTNRYNIICAPFVSVNHHWKNVLFSCAFLLDEKTEALTWLFDTFLESMGGQKPKTIFTDYCQAMANGIEKVFSGVCNCLYSWHISHNCAKYMSSLYMNMLYALHAKWCSEFSHDTFTCQIQSLQRSESTNNIFHNISTKTMRLIEFVHHYDKQATKIHTSESKEVTQMSGILKHDATIYSRKMFKIFEKDCGTVHSLELNEEGRTRVYLVQLNSSNGTIYCSCKMFESMGLLCRHALRVLKVKGKLSITLRRNTLIATKVAMKKLREMEELIEKDMIKSKDEITVTGNNSFALNYCSITFSF